MPDFRSNPDARNANANGDIPVPLSNPKASLSWANRTTSDKVSTDSGSGSAFAPAQGYRDKEQYQGAVDIAASPMNDRDGRPHPFSVRIMLLESRCQRLYEDILYRLDPGTRWRRSHLIE